MADTPGEMTALRAEVEYLRGEVAHLRSQQAAHVCAQPQVLSVPWQANACAGGFTGQVYMVDLGKSLTFDMPVNACAGAAAAPQNVILNG